MTTVELTATRSATGRQSAVDQSTRALCVLFFCSGFPALIYQLAWQRALFRIFGVNIESATIVVTAFMLGLGLGSLAGGLISKRRIPALLPLAAIEGATAVFGGFSLAIFDGVGALTAAWPLPAIAVVNLGLVFVPTLLMGATLPLLVAHLVRRSGHVGSAVGLLYYVNTLGAGAACLVCTVLLFPFLGMHGAVYVAAAMNCAVAIGALAMHRQGDHASFALETPAIASLAALKMRRVLVLAAAGGFISLSYEIFLFRTVSYVSGSSATAFAATLSAFLVGVASGSRQAGENCERASGDDATRHALRTLGAACLLGFAFLPLLDHLAWLDRGVVGVAMVMTYLIARSWGSLLPYLAELGVPADDSAGLRTALLYLANIAGAATGSILTGFVLMDHMGLVAIGVTLVIAGLLCTVLLGLSLKASPLQNARRIGLAAACAAAAFFLIPRSTTDVLANLQWKGSPEAKPLVEIVQNRSGIITVDADGTVFGHGMYDGKFNTDLKHDDNGIIRPYALSLFHPAPRNVLMIGLSSGSWAQVIANNPNVEALTVVEINPGYRQLIARHSEVASVLKNVKVNIVTDDGRRWLRQHPQTFDAIVSNTTWHFRDNVTNLLSVEFLEMVRSHLNPGGIFFYNTTDSARSQRTGCVVFGQGARFTNHMVVSQTPISWNFPRWRRTLEAYRIDGRPLLDVSRADDRAKLDSLEAWQTSLEPKDASAEDRPIEPCPEVMVRTAGKALITDNNMGNEWRYFLGLE